MIRKVREYGRFRRGTVLRLVQVATAVLVLVATAYRFWPFESPTALNYSKSDIAQLLRYPKDYDGKPVTVTGTVSGNAGILGYGGYRIRQGDSEILVISGRGIPGLEQNVTVSGIFRQALSLNSYTYPVIVEKK